jgi:hypothetical protein
VNTLCTGKNLLSTDEKIKAIGQLWILLMIKGCEERSGKIHYSNLTFNDIIINLLQDMAWCRTVSQREDICP